LKHPAVYDYTKTRLDTITHHTRRGSSEFGLTNTNRLIRSYSGCTGLKTGSTAQALFCIAATAFKEGMNLIAVVMAAPDPTTRFDSAMKLLDYGYANYALITKDPAGTNVGSIRIYKGRVENAPVVVKNQTSMLAPKGKYVVVDSQVKLLDGLPAPVMKNAKAGEIIYTCEGNEVGRSEVIVTDAIPKATVYNMMGRLFKRWMMR
jgi:D-alanyl-D-alanine carboxypeptidase (penicillin-binding protein 5/6)